MSTWFGGRARKSSLSRATRGSSGKGKPPLASFVQGSPVAARYRPPASATGPRFSLVKCKRLQSEVFLWRRIFLRLTTPVCLPRPRNSKSTGMRTTVSSRGSSRRSLTFARRTPYLCGGGGAGVSPWRRMISIIFARSGGPPPATPATSAASRKNCGPIAAGVTTHSPFTSFVPLLSKR